MDETKFLAERFEANRGHLQAVAWRMLGSRSEAEDAVQETWLRLSRTDTSAVDNLGGWLTTVVARVCLDMLRARKSRREEAIEGVPEPAAGDTDPDHERMLADSVGLAMLVVLEKLTPPERVAFVLHDMFGLPFEDIAPVVDRSLEATRQLASRARRRVRGASAEGEDDVARRQEVVTAFLAASRDGKFEALLTMLDPDVVFRADAVAAKMGAPAEVRGAAAVAGLFNGRAQGALPARVDDGFGFAVVIGGQLRVMVRFSFDGERIAAIDSFADPAVLQAMEWEALS